MLTTRIFLIALCCPLLTSAQILPDQLWLSGTHDIPGQPGYGNTVLKFEAGQVSATQADLRMNFESTMAVMPDSLGNILFYTNGCYMASSTGDTMLNGAGLNPGEMADWTCPTSGYAAPMGAMALQLPGSDHLYYLFHIGVRYSPERKLHYGPFYYTIIDMALEGGKGAVVSKNNVLADGSFEPFVAVRHGNGRDWWLVFPEYGTNRYTKILFSTQGIQSIETQEIGPSLSCRYIGSSAFSPDGSRYARQQHCGVAVLDFDRCSGIFSNGRLIGMPLRAILGGGVAFSKDGNKLLVSTQLSVQEADLTAPVPVLDTIVASIDIVGASLLLMQYAPNGKIYLSNLGRTPAYHVINKPDAPLIDFQRRGLALPNYVVRTLPNYPNHRLYDLPGSVCDTLGINAPMVSTHAPEKPKVAFWPNPAQDQLFIQTESPIEGIAIVDALGRQWVDIQGLKKAGKTAINVRHLPIGVYFVVIRFPSNVWSGKFLKAGN